MFDHPAVIVLGAGSSRDFGLPLGNELWSQILRDCRGYLDVPTRYGKPGFGIPPEQVLRSYLADARREDAKGYCLFSSIRELRADRPNFSINELADLIEQGNVHGSVDDFLRDHPSLRKPVTALIVGQIFERLYENRGHGRWGRKAAPFSAEFETSNGTTLNWIRRFAGNARAHLLNRTNPARVTVINFNYDKVFETTLRHVWERSELKYADLDECFEFLYPYGSFETLYSEVEDAGEFLLKQRDRIGLAGTEAHFETLIQTRVIGADRIYVCGLSCAESAIKVLALDRTEAPIFAQNFGRLDQRLDRLLRERLGVTAEAIDPGSMSVLVTNGFFEQGSHERETPIRQRRPKVTSSRRKKS